MMNYLGFVCLHRATFSNHNPGNGRCDVHIRTQYVYLRMAYMVTSSLV